LSFYITKVRLQNFRNYGSFEFDVSPDTTIIIGHNAIGKTNIIEAVQLLTMMESFRKPSWEEVTQWETDTASFSLEAVEDKRQIEIECRIEDGKRTYLLNGKRRNGKELKGILPATLFIPDDLIIIKGAAERRRDALDAIGTQISATYLALKNDYEKVVRQRNILLKDDDAPQDLLDSWTASLISIGSLFMAKRQSLFALLRARFIETYRFLSPQDDVDMEYIPSWDLREHGYAPEEAFERLLIDLVAEERGRRTTILGPHKDDIRVFLNGRNARQFASQGQQRLLVLAWKLAELDVLEEITGKRPVLLLDDVMSELDAQRRGIFLSYIRGRTQTIITTTNREYFPEDVLEEALVMQL